MPPKQKRSIVTKRRGRPSKKPKTVQTQGGSSSQNKKSRLLPAPDPFIWTTDRELDLLYSMIGLKPAGINKHLNVMLTRERFSECLNINVSTDVIWEYCASLWDLELADKLENSTIPIKFKDFELPKTEEWGKLIKEAEDKIDSGLAVQKQMSQPSTSRIPTEDLMQLKSVRVVIEPIDEYLKQLLIDKYENRCKTANSSTTSKNGPNGDQTKSSSSNVNTGVERKQSNTDKDTDKN